jgi:hypothetical protein
LEIVGELFGSGEGLVADGHVQRLVGSESRQGPVLLGLVTFAETRSFRCTLSPLLSMK